MLRLTVRLNIFIIQVSITIVTYNHQNILIVQATEQISLNESSIERKEFEQTSLESKSWRLFKVCVNDSFVVEALDDFTKLFFSVAIFSLQAGFEPLIL
jgi:hypothetical protein